jgi:hypothetical protein
MSKVVLNDVAAGYNVSTINSNFDKIETALNNKVLYRDNPTGEPNELKSDLDFNGKNAYNVGTLGVSSIEIGGVSLEPGDAVTNATIQPFEFTATAGQTVFSVAPFTPTTTALLVEVNGVSYPSSSVATSGSNVTIPACELGDEVIIRVFTRSIGPAPTAEELQFIQTGTGATTRSVQSKLRDFISVKDFGAIGNGVVDDTVAFQNALTANKNIYVPAGSYKITSVLTVPSGCSIYGDGPQSALNFHGCNGITIPAGASFVCVERVGLFSNTALGVGDPRLYVGIGTQGTNPSNVNYVTLDNIYLQGWADAINWKYTWNSRIENVTTVNTNNGLVLFGQSVNNSVNGSRLVSNGGTSSITLQNDGAIIGEGLMVSDTLLASGTYGVFVPLGFLSLHINNCVVDLVTGDGFRTTDCKDLRVSNSWVYATNCAVRLQALGASDAQGVSLVGNRFQVTSATGRCIEQNGANLGLSILGNRFTHGGTSLGIYLDGQAAVIDGNYFNNTGSGSSIFINGSPTTHRIGKNTGTVTIGGGTGVLGTPEYTEGDWTVSDQSGAGLVITNNAQARFVKNGRQVTVHMDIRYPVTANASVARLSLPFQPDTGAAPAGCLGFQDINGVFMPNASTAAANFVFWKPGASGAFATNADVSGARFVITFTYRANA